MNFRAFLIAATAAATLHGSLAQAGGMAEPIVEAESIVEDTAAAGSANGMLLPILGLILVAALVAGSGSPGTK